MIEIKGKKILLLGLGLHGGGVATAKWLVRHGADLIISDLKTSKELSPSLAKLQMSLRTKQSHRQSSGLPRPAMAGLAMTFVLGRHREQDVKWADIIVYSPGVPKESPYLKLGRRLGKLIINEAALFFDRCPAMIIGVTGTRGKSTTVSLIGAILKLDFRFRGNDKRKVIVAGNIRDTAMLDVIDKIKKHDIVVLELSSWQLEGLSVIKKSPHIAVATNLYPDHLNRYKKLSDYYDSKKEIWRYQTQDDYLVLNKNNKPLRSWSKLTKSHAVFFSKRDVPLSFLRRQESSFGAHNLENAITAVTVANLLGVKDSIIKKVLCSPPVLTGRQEIIAKKNGVTFVNDTCATSPEAGIAALKRFGASGGKHKRILLIAGGADKNLKYDEWAAAARTACREIYLLAGDASQKMVKALAGFQHAHAGYAKLSDILKQARALSRPNDIILFSPAAASFNLWQHEFARGDDFTKLVKLTT